MSNIAGTLSQLACLKQFTDNGYSELDIRGWVANQNYFIDSDIEESNFVLRTNDSQFFVSLANDCDRMSRASFETACNIQANPIFPKSASWHFIQSYYAAFFAAHALLRIFGVSCTQFEIAHMDKIREQAKVLRKDNGIQRIKGGFFKLEYKARSKEILFTRVNDSHKDTWTSFYNLVKTLIQSIDKTTALTKDKLEATDLLINIKDGLTKSRAGTAGNSPSILRNNINYKHNYGLWYPFKGQNLGAYNKNNCNKEWLQDPINVPNLNSCEEIESAFRLNLLIVSLLLNLLLECNRKHANQSKIFKNGSLKMINIIMSA